jgi:uncharacterized protein
MRYLVLVLFLLPMTGHAQNHLQGAQSPYLLQHLDNPVDWYPWGAEALAKAKAEQKMIFVSVGYSACHWCHVMEEESFENPEIAAYLNQHFVSVKIDREERPDLDEQFMMVTQLAVGAGGWPNSVFLTPDAKPFYGDTYLPPEIFTQVLNQMTDLWDHQPEVLDGEAFKIGSQLEILMAQQATRTTLAPEYFHEVATLMLGEMDPFNGGIGSGNKFPREPLFLFLMDQAERRGDADILAAVTDLLDGMILGGIHDQVGGGFHRYSVDPSWHVPHFEKMLYTQALTGRLLIRAWAATKQPHYKRAAERLFDFTLRELHDPAGGFYSALDADSINAAGEFLEGAFYTWTPQELGLLAEGAQTITDLFQLSQNGELDGRNVLNLAALPSTAQYATIDPMLATLLVERDKRKRPFKDRKILLAWNAEMIATMAEASFRLNRRDLFEHAANAARFILSNMQNPDGLNRVYYAGKSSTKAQLPDYAAFGLALVALHDFDPNPDQRVAWLAAAVDIGTQIQTRFGSAEAGYFMTENGDGITRIIPVDDTELQAGNAQALALFARLKNRANTPKTFREGTSLNSTMSGFASEIPDQRATALTAIEDFQLQQTGPIRYRSEGNVRVVMTQTAPEEFKITLAMKPGWHVNSTTPLEDYFIPTSVGVENAELEAARFPDAKIKSLGFNEKPLSLFEGQIEITGKITRTAAAATLSFGFQACSDELCLQPEILTFTLW